MKPERFQQIERLVSLALEQQPLERAHLLDKACAGDDQLRERVESLLRAHEHLGDFLAKPASDMMAEVLAAEGSHTAEPTPSAEHLGDGSAPTSAAPLTFNERYIVEGELGRGGMGRVYVARDTKLGRRVAIKVLVHRAHDQDALRRFEQEARVAGSLNHPNVLTIYDIGMHEGEPYIVSELLEGGTLREHLDGSPLAVGKAIQYAAQLAEGLRAAHQKGIIHRDLKPENLFITDDGRLKILDFGIAKLVAPETPSPDLEPPLQSQTGAIVGTVGYMSPEQVRGQNADHRSDIFTAGVLLYEMLSGKRPFEANSLVETAYAILNTEPSELRDHVPVSLDRLVQRCLRKKREERFQSAHELGFRLRSLSDSSRGRSDPFAPRASPWNTPENRPNNLPVALTPLLGREHELKAVCNQLLRDEVRLLTLTGPGGTGKTRLALEAAALLLDGFADGVFFVSLEPLRVPGLVASTIAQVLRVRETAGQLLVEDLKEYLQNKTLLLVLDNCEQVSEAASLIVDLLAMCPKLKALVTSRVPLHVRGEQEFSVPPLALPDRHQLPPVDRLRKYGAVALFVQRALAVKPEFAFDTESAPALVEICHRLDGLPLAIELAAARSKLLSPRAMLVRMEHRLSLLTGGARDLPARHQTMRGAIDWSYRLLSPNEQTLFRRLAVFVAGFGLEAAEALCSAGGRLQGELLDGLQALVDGSLLRQEEQSDGEPRFFLLETIREYGIERLAESGEAPATRQQHALYCLALAERAAPLLFSPQQTAWLARLEQEHDNLRAALDWFEEERQVEQGFRLAGALSWFWVPHGHLTEGRDRVARLLSKGRADHTAARAKALNVAGTLAIQHGDHRAARTHLEESLAICRELADKGGIFSALASLGAVATQQRDYAAARSHSEEMLTIGKELRNYDFFYHALLNLGNLAHEQGDYSAARSYYERCLAIKQKLGIKVGVFVSLQSLGLVAHDQGDHAAARSFYEESLAIAREMEDHRGTALSLAKLGEVTTAQGDYAVARSCLEESLTISRARGDKASMAFAVERLAGLAAAQCQPSRSLRLAGIATALRQAIGSQIPAAVRAQLEHKVQPSRHALSAEVAAAALAEGRAMLLDEAVAYAMSSEVQDGSSGLP